MIGESNKKSGEQDLATRTAYCDHLKAILKHETRNLRREELVRHAKFLGVVVSSKNKEALADEVSEAIAGRTFRTNEHFRAQGEYQFHINPELTFEGEFPWLKAVIEIYNNSMDRVAAKGKQNTMTPTSILANLIGMNSGPMSRAAFGNMLDQSGLLFPFNQMMARSGHPFQRPAETTGFREDKPCFCRFNSQLPVLQSTSETKMPDQLIGCIACGGKFHSRCVSIIDEKDAQVFECPYCTLERNDPLSEVIKVMVPPFYVGTDPPSTMREFLIDQSIFDFMKSRDAHGLEIRCVRVDGKHYEQTWPDSGELFINSIKAFEFKPLAHNSSLKKRKDEKLFIRTGYIHAGINRALFNVIRIDAARNTQVKVTKYGYYVAAIYLVKKLSPEELTLKLQRQKRMPMEESRARLQRAMGVETELEFPQINVPITCPLDYQLLKTPAKGNLCNHVGCFSLESFVYINSRSNVRKWKCPICKVRAYDMVIDSFMDDIIKTKRARPELIAGEIVMTKELTYTFIEEKADDFDDQSDDNINVPREAGKTTSMNRQGKQQTDSFIVIDEESVAPRQNIDEARAIQAQPSLGHTPPAPVNGRMEIQQPTSPFSKTMSIEMVFKSDKDGSKDKPTPPNNIFQMSPSPDKEKQAMVAETPTPKDKAGFQVNTSRFMGNLFVPKPPLNPTLPLQSRPDSAQDRMDLALALDLQARERVRAGFARASTNCELFDFETFSDNGRPAKRREAKNSERSKPLVKIIRKFYLDEVRREEKKGRKEPQPKAVEKPAQPTPPQQQQSEMRRQSETADMQRQQQMQGQMGQGQFPMFPFGMNSMNMQQGYSNIFNTFNQLGPSKQALFDLLTQSNRPMRPPLPTFPKIGERPQQQQQQQGDRRNPLRDPPNNMSPFAMPNWHPPRENYRMELETREPTAEYHHPNGMTQPINGKTPIDNGDAHNGKERQQNPTAMVAEEIAKSGFSRPIVAKVESGVDKRSKNSSGFNEAAPPQTANIKLAPRSKPRPVDAALIAKGKCDTDAIMIDD